MQEKLNPTLSVAGKKFHLTLGWGSGEDAWPWDFPFSLVMLLLLCLK